MQKNGFTLAELLIALLILGVIATFTIPKVLQSQSDNKYKSMAKEMAGMISGAYQAYKLEKGVVPSNMPASALTPYLNYVALKTTSTVDFNNCTGTATCSGGFICLTMHNGGTLVTNSVNFNGTDELAAVNFAFDPDSAVSSVKGVEFWQYYNGFITARGTIKENSHNSVFADADPDPTCDPPWFNWN